MDISITQLCGVGSIRAKSFEKLGVETADRLLRLYPRRYEDIGNIVDIAFLADNRGKKVTLCVSVCGVITEKRLQGGKLLTSVPVCDDSGAVVISYFNNKFIKNSLKRGQTYYFYAKVTETGVPMMYNPEVFSKIDRSCALLPVYPLKASLSQGVVRRCMQEALGLVTLSEPLPEFVRDKYQLLNIDSAIYKIHKPSDMRDVETARKRLIFEELLYFSLGLRLMRGREKTAAGTVVTGEIGNEYLNLHRFLPTEAQMRVLTEIYSDLKSGFTMHRLLQGDVGSGKTLVAGQCAYTVIKSGAQVAIMAPTEVLANQHYDYFSKIMGKLGITCACLTSSVKGEDKKNIKNKIKTGDTSLIIGTHAILQNDVRFSNLGLVVTDEQHRFGVMQRTDLIAKGKGVHVLAMSATPIPRTLALMMWGDMDLSVIDTLPGGRQKIKTNLIDSSLRSRMYGFIEKNIAQGGQVYYVCPMVEEDEETDLANAKTRFKELSKLFGEQNTAMVYGKMKACDKDKNMRDFAQGKIKILVSTTVIEVGINVPNATLMVIENAERFGLSQLHQLRGRVGRGSDQSYCILMSDSTSQSAVERLDYFSKTCDGFEIAQKDLTLRGPGNFFGSEQHGLPQMQIASLNDSMQNFQDASECAGALIENSPDLSDYPLIKQSVTSLFESCLKD